MLLINVAGTTTCSDTTLFCGNFSFNVLMHVVFTNSTLHFASIRRQSENNTATSDPPFMISFTFEATTLIIWIAAFYMYSLFLCMLLQYISLIINWSVSEAWNCILLCIRSRMVTLDTTTPDNNSTKICRSDLDMIDMVCIAMLCLPVKENNMPNSALQPVN